jgi:hypothetical protein
LLEVQAHIGRSPELFRQGNHVLKAEQHGGCANTRHYTQHRIGQHAAVVIEYVAKLLELHDSQCPGRVAKLPKTHTPKSLYYRALRPQ